MGAGFGENLVAHEHGEILVHRIVAVIDISTGKFTELHLDLHLA